MTDADLIDTIAQAIRGEPCAGELAWTLLTEDRRAPYREDAQRVLTALAPILSELKRGREYKKALEELHAVVLGLEGGFVVLGARTSRMSVKEMAEMITFLEYGGVA